MFFVGGLMLALVCFGWWCVGRAALWALGKASPRAEQAVRNAFREAWREERPFRKKTTVRVKRPVL